MVPAFPPTSFGNDKACFFEHAKMLHDGAAIELRKSRAEHAGCERLRFQLVEDASPYAMAKRLENQVIKIVI